MSGRVSAHKPGTKKNSRADLGFEDRMQRLQVIVGSLERGEGPLAESVALYKEGLAHAQACRELLARARHEIEMCGENGISPFTDDPSGEQSEAPHPPGTSEDEGGRHGV